MPDSRASAAHYDAFYAAEDFARPVGFADALAVQLRRWLPAGARVLEAGCGTGTLVTACRAHGLAATGFDLSHVGGCTAQPPTRRAALSWRMRWPHPSRRSRPTRWCAAPSPCSTSPT